MYVKRLTGLSGEKSSVFCYPDLLDTGPVFMFGTFDLADGTSRGSGYAPLFLPVVGLLFVLVGYNDLGTMLCLLALVVGLLWAAGVRLRVFAALTVVGLARRRPAGRRGLAGRRLRRAGRRRTTGWPG